MDCVREAMNVDAIYSPSAGSDIISYSGKGVVVGIIDTGFDQHHIAFDNRMEPGTSRVSRLVHTQGAYESENLEFQAVVYDTPETISNAPVQISADGHGTHVAGIAAGWWDGNPYSGIAPDADIVAVSMGDAIYDDEILYGIDYVLEYAAEVGRPAIVNLSLGSEYGPQDGTGFISDYLQNVPQKGSIVAFAAGNDGHTQTTIDVDFAATDAPFSTCLVKRFYYDAAAPASMVQLWSDDSREFELIFKVMDRASGKEIYRTDEVSYSALGTSLENGLSLIDGNDGQPADFSMLSQFFQGEMYVVGGVSAQNGRYMVELLAMFNNVKADYPYLLAIEVSSREKAHVMGVNNVEYSYFGSAGIPGFKSGTAEHSISDFCTSPYVISVGSYNYRSQYSDTEGSVLHLNTDAYGVQYEVADYSSWGENKGIPGTYLPHVLAPGTFVLAPLNTSWVDGEKENGGVVTLADAAEVDGQRYYWGEKTGTSMATPAVAGVIALWLEAKPDLTRDQILEVMQATCVQDSYTVAQPQRSGYGKIDAYAGIKYIHSHWLSSVGGILNAASALKPSLRCLSSEALECVLPAKYAQGMADVYSVDGKLISKTEFNSNIFIIPRPEEIAILRIHSCGETSVIKLP